MASTSPPRLGLVWLGLGLLAIGAGDRPAEAGGLFHKKGQLIAVPTATQAAAPVAIVAAAPVQAAPISVLQLQHAPTIATAPVQLGVAQAVAPVRLQAQSAPAPSPTIHITVVEAAQAQPQAAPPAQAMVQAAPQATAQVQLGAAPPQALSTVAAFLPQVIAVPQAVPVTQAVPVQLFYVPPTHKCSLFCKH